MADRLGSGPPAGEADDSSDSKTESLAGPDTPTFLLDRPADPDSTELLPDRPPWGEAAPASAAERSAGSPPQRAVVEREMELLSRHARFRVERLLGEGGMGRVYRAIDEELGRPVALKVLFAADPEADARFAREAQAQARVDHPHVGKVYETGAVEGRRYIAMQYIEGQTLAQAAEAMTVEQKARTLQAVCEGVHAAHRLGLVHRDIKPANVLVAVTADGDFHPYVVDFGIARDAAAGQTMTGAVVGTPAYMAPEQVSGGTVDRRTDVYALGATLYQLLSGRLPIRGTGSVDMLVRVMQEEPEPLSRAVPHIAADLETIVMKCLEKDPARRYDSARALAEDLGRFLDGEPIAARPASRLYRWGKRARKHRGAVALGALALAVIAVAVALLLREALLARRLEELSARYGAEAERLEWMLRAERQMPLHDTRPLEDRLLARLGEMRAAEAGLSRRERGPLLYALGRGQLALGEDLLAEETLDAAWAAGLRTAEAAYFRGKAKALALKRALDRARRQDGAARAAAIGEAMRHYRTDVVELLALGREAPLIAEEYGEALLHWADGRPREAIAKSRAALARAPFEYEDHILIGDAELEIARAATAAAERAAAEQRAEAAYLAALAIGASDPRPYERLCALLLERARGQGGGGARELAAAARERCRQALAADRRDDMARELEAEIRGFLGGG
jgi:serine/threonine-protein kinase